MTIEEKVKEIFFKLGADLCGFASIDRFENTPKGFHPKEIYNQCNTVIVHAIRMPLGTLSVDSRIIYLKAMEEGLKELDRISFLASNMIEGEYGTAVPLPSDSPYEYWDEERREGKGLMSMKHAAELAGLGRIGKNTLLITPQYGNMIALGCVLTELKLKADPLADNLCRDNCRICIKKCPQKALDGTTINQKLCRQIVYTTNQKGFSICNCNICRKVCPMGQGVGRAKQGGK